MKNDYSWKEWESLNYDEKRNVWNHVWNPYNPEIGEQTKKEIIDNFIESIKIDAHQFGLKSFGWGAYMLYIIVDNSKIRIPKKFGDLSVNKGVITEKKDSQTAIVKFGYGGKMEIDLTKRIIIG